MRHSTRSPKKPFAFDLHVLSTPPTFVLSQDQTLQFDILNLFAEIFYYIHLITQDLNKGVTLNYKVCPCDIINYVTVAVYKYTTVGPVCFCIVIQFSRIDAALTNS